MLSKFEDLREALEKLKLNDASLSFEPETSKALGFGFRCGFLGLLHMEIIEERIEREFGIDLIATSPSVVYEVILSDGSKMMVDSPTKCQREKLFLRLWSLMLKLVFLHRLIILVQLWNFVRINVEHFLIWNI